MTPRLSLLPDPRFAPFRGALRERIDESLGALEPADFGALLDPLMRSVLEQGFAAAGADEGMIWLERGGNLFVAYRSVADPDGLVGTFCQPVRRGTADEGGRRPGLVSGVYLHEQPFCENEVDRHAEQDSTLDRRLGVRTTAMIALPLYFAEARRGVVSCVQLLREGEPRPEGFGPGSLAAVQLATETLSRLLDHRLLGVATGLDP